MTAAPFALGRKSDSTATVVFVGENGELSFGDAAERRGVSHPEHLIREFKRRVGDEVPISVDGRAFRVEHLYARTVADVVQQVSEREGAEPAGIALTHPTAWGTHRLELIRSALAEAGVTDVEFITEPEAAARHYEATRPIDIGQTLAVYDLGGGTFDTVLLRKEIDGSFDIVGDQVGIEDLGGADFDDAVVRHVIATSGIVATSLPMDDPEVLLALSQLRRECVDAKEALSFDSETTIPLLVPPHRTSVRLTRSEFETMISPHIDRTLDAVDEALESADLEPEAIESILLIGGSSRIPQIAQRLSERFNRPIAVDADPKAAIALGAARTALVRARHPQLPGTMIALSAADSDALALFEDAPVGDPDETAGGTDFPTAPAESDSFTRMASPFLLAGAAITIAVAIVFASVTSAGSGTIDAAGFPVSSGSTTPSPAASSPAAQDDAASAAPIEKVLDAPPAPDQKPVSPRNPRQQAKERAVEQTKQSSPTAKPTATTPATNTVGSGNGSNPSPTPTSNPSAPPGAPDPTPEPSESGSVTPTDPEPTDPEPTDPPADPGIPTPVPSDPGTPTPEPADPEPTDPEPDDPGTTPAPADPEPTEPATEPSPDSTPPV